MVLQHGQRADSLRRLARKFLDYSHNGDYDAIWNEMITVEAQNLISTTAFPLTLLKEGRADQFLDLDDIHGLALGFQMDVEGMRTGFFSGVVSQFDELGWYKFSPEDTQKSMVFSDGRAAVLVGDLDTKPLMLFFIRDDNNDFMIDWEALAVFSMTMSSQSLFEIGTIALVNGKPDAAELFFNFSRDLLPAYQRLKHLVWNHPVVGQIVTPTRKAELEAELLHALRARDEARAARTGGRPHPAPIDMHAFLKENFKRYSEVTQFPLEGDELRILQEMSDASLRMKVASVHVKADPVIAMREATKPHGPVELADIVVEVSFQGGIYSLCLPFKSGREYRSSQSVPSSMAYQVWRPHMFISRAVVVLITAKPCSQNLLNDLRQSRDRLGWPIEVIEGSALGSLLKANDLLYAS